MADNTIAEIIESIRSTSYIKHLLSTIQIGPTHKRNPNTTAHTIIHRLIDL